MKKLLIVFLLLASKSAYAGQDFCGRLSSLPDGFILHERGKSEIFFAGDNSMPPDPKKVYDYLNAKHPDSDRSCYCITGAVTSGGMRGKLDRRFSGVEGLKRCGGATLR